MKRESDEAVPETLELCMLKFQRINPCTLLDRAQDVELRRNRGWGVRIGNVEFDDHDTLEEAAWHAVAHLIETWAERYHENGTSRAELTLLDSVVREEPKCRRQLERLVQILVTRLPPTWRSQHKGLNALEQLQMLTRPGVRLEIVEKVRGGR